MDSRILQTRYDFHHNKRFFKLGQIAELVEDERAFKEE